MLGVRVRVGVMLGVRVRVGVMLGVLVRVGVMLGVGVGVRDGHATGLPSTPFVYSRNPLPRSATPVNALVHPVSV
jgi:hypothetical protein